MVNAKFLNTDTLYGYPNELVDNMLQITNETGSEVSITDYRLSCECVLLEDLKKPSSLKSDSSILVPIRVKIDSADIGKAKLIAVSLKLDKKPYLISSTFILKVLSR